MVIQKFLIFGIIVILLTQQYTTPSADLGEKVDEERPPRRLGLGQGIVERARKPGLGRGRRQGDESQQIQNETEFSHRDISFRAVAFVFPVQ
jgi:hypothetical protein